MISERGEVKVLDFGIMKATQRVSQTESGTVKGSVGFMSPEQARGKPVDHRSDLFSLGLVILYAATGEPTYPGEAFYDLLTAAAAGPGDAERTRIAALPTPLPAILERALQFDPDRRFQTSTEFRAAIRRTPSAPAPPSSRTSCSGYSATSCAPNRIASPPHSRSRRGHLRRSARGPDRRRRQARRPASNVTGSGTSGPGKC